MCDFEVLLRDRGLRKTVFRKELLELFYKTSSSLTAEEIRNKIDTTNDKVTIYRALDAFEKNGLIHRVPDKNNLTRYALCKSECSSHQHTHNHAHFICNNCNETFCINEVEIPEIKISKKFQIKSSKLTLEGNCFNCAIT